MARRRAASAFIRCVAYTLRVINNADNGTDLDLKATGEDGEEYNLQLTTLGDRTALAQTMFDRLGVLWPAFDFEFRADSVHRIVEIR